MKRTFTLGVVLAVVSLLLVGCLGVGGGEYAISGVIKDLNGDGVAEVRLLLEGEKTSTTAETDEDGNWIAKVTGTVSVIPKKEMWAFDKDYIVVKKKNKAVNFVGIPNIFLFTDGGDGTVTKTVLEDQQLELEAIAAEGYVFDGWDVRTPSDDPFDFQNDELNPENPIIVDLASPKIVTAYFDFVGGSYITGSFEVIHSFPMALEEEFADAPSAFTRRGEILDDLAFDYGFVEDEFIVMYNDFDYVAQSAQLERAGYKIIDKLELLNAYLVTYDRDVKLIEDLDLLSGIASVDRNGIVKPFALNIPDEKYYWAQWHYQQIRMAQAWSVTTGSRDVRIGVVDTGIDKTHYQLRDNLDLENAYDFSMDGDVQDSGYHGTHVSGTIGAISNMGGDMAGIMWEVSLLPVKVFDGRGSATNWTVVHGMLYAAGLLNEPGKPYNPAPVDVINLSLGGGWSQFEEDAVKLIDAAGVIIVAAAGNNGVGLVSYPAAHPEVIAVGAVGKVDKNDPHGFVEPPLADYSNWGSEIDVVAPGGAGRVVNDYVWSTVPGDDWGGAGGTSMATPHVAGVVGLMLSNGIPKDQVREILHRTSMEIHLPTPNIFFGHGLINAYWAVNDVRNIRFIQGLREGENVDVVAETSIPLKGGQFRLDLLEGEYQFIAWIDANKNGIVDAGDYYAETPVLEIKEGSRWRWIDEIEELPFDFDPADDAVIVSKNQAIKVH